MFNCYGYGIRGNEQLTQDDINCKGKFADKLGNFVSVAETLFPIAMGTPGNICQMYVCL
jgi:hypothetical protein